MIDDYEDSKTNHSPRHEIRHGVRHLTHDIVTLVELQSQLLKVDLRNWLNESLVPGVLILSAAGLVAMACLPLLLFSLAYYIAGSTELGLAASLLIVGGSGLLIALIAGVAGWAAIRRGSTAFDRFQVELSQNLAWLKQVLGSPVETAEELPSAVGPRPR